MVGILFALAGLLATPEATGAPASVRLVDVFTPDAFAEPEPLFWPAYFWLWNAPLDEHTLRAQLEDMATHGARSVCMLPMPKGFRPDSTNNSMEPDYLTPEYFEKVRVAVDEAAKLNMNWWLYDEGGWPSGLALGKVVEGRPELARQRIIREAIALDAPFTVPRDSLALVVEGTETKVFAPGDVWTPVNGTAAAHLYQLRQEGSSDLMNPDAVQRFIQLTHEGYAAVLKSHFGSTIQFTFTDEPGAAMPRMPDHMPWTPGLDTIWKGQTGTELFGALPRLFSPQHRGARLEEAQNRIAMYDLLSGRFADVYFGGLETWGRNHGLASGGHLGGEDETLGAVKYSFGHVLRPLRRMDVPGVDLIWRQLVPGAGPQSNFPVLAPTAAHQNGTRFAFSESFCVYGNGLTPAQMKWLLDYQYVRGINLMVLGCYPLSTRDHHMTGERPHFGGMNPLWDHLPGFHAYTARLGYALSVGAPAIRTAIYYPVRDLWAWGTDATEAVATYEALQAGVAERPCAFDLIDDDMIAKSSLQDGALAVGPMRYDTVLCGDVRWMAPESLNKLEALASSGGRVLAVDHAPAVDGGTGDTGGPIEAGTLEEVLKSVTPSVRLAPPSTGLRALVRTLPGREIVMLFNEGREIYAGTLDTAFSHACELDMQHGTMRGISIDEGHLAVSLAGGESVVYLLSNDATPGAQPDRMPGDSIAVTPPVVSRVRQWIAGEHDFEQVNLPTALPTGTGPWKDSLGEDFSGEVDYRFTFDVTPGQQGQPLRLETDAIDYAASVFLDGDPVGQLLWYPWRLDLPPCAAGKHELEIRVANTLANELTSKRVIEAWSARSGPGWPSPYHERALVFEKESRGGGMGRAIRLSTLTDVAHSVPGAP